MINPNPYINYEKSGLSRKFKNLKEWEKYTKNPKYCGHVNGYIGYNDGSSLRCKTCGEEKK